MRAPRGIVQPGMKMSDRLMLKMTAEKMGIPETDADAAAQGLNKTASEEQAGDKKHSAYTTPCPECESPMLKGAEMVRCAVCGYAEAAPEKEPVTVVTAADKSVMDYYKQIYPDAYAKELIDEKPGKALADGKKDYGMVKGASIRVTAREVLA